MKILPAHLGHLKSLIAHLDTEERRRQYRQDFDNGHIKAKDESKRYRWDLLYASQEATRFVCDVLYKYSHDEHIDTALRSLVKPLAEGKS